MGYVWNMYGLIHMHVHMHIHLHTHMHTHAHEHALAHRPEEGRMDAKTENTVQAAGTRICKFESPGVSF